MRVLILSQYYRPEPIPKPAELAEALRDRGHTVSVITGLPNYPTGRLYPGYRLQLFRRETIGGIPVVRSFEFPYHGRSVLGRILNYVSFMLSAPFAALLAPVCDVVYVWHPPLTMGVAAWLIARARRVPFLYDVQDIWPESVVLSGLLRPKSRLMPVIAWLERFVYARADHINVVSEGARENLLSKGVPSAKLSTLPHWTDDCLFDCAPPQVAVELRQELGWGERFVVLFAGNIGLVQGLDNVIAAATHLSLNANVRVAFVGDGADKKRLQTLALQSGLSERVQFIDQQPADRIPAFMAAADLLLVHLKRSNVSHCVIPTKMLAYMAAARPMLVAMEGAAADLARSAGAGLVVPPEDPPALARAILDVARMSPESRAEMGIRGREHLKAHLAKEKAISEYESLLVRVGRRGTEAAPGTGPATGPEA